MARGTKKNGFDPTRIVKVDSTTDLNKDKTDDKTPDGIINKIRKDPNEKQRMFVYLDPDIAYKVKEYGKQVGRAAGGNGRIITEALNEFFKKHRL